MNTPIYNFVKGYADKNSLRLHMPGHKGTNFLGVEKFDITEIDGADVLYHNDGIILESQKNASNLFKTKKTLYSTEGSSLSIRAMLYLSMIYAKSNNKKPLILAFRNAHKSFMHAVATLDIDVNWVYPNNDNSLLSCIISPEELEKKILSIKDKPTALYVTSPDYLGNILDIESYSKICKKYGILLLVDNAHGAYLAFTSKPNHPILLGADITCDSAHKTLPVITGGSYLHISNQAPSFISEMAETAMQIFASTSPSYLILSSLDNFNKISKDYTIQLNSFENHINNLKNELILHGFKLIGDELLKLTIMSKTYGYTGNELAKILLNKNIVCEFYDEDFVVMMFSPYMKIEELSLLRNTLLSIPKKSEIIISAPKLSKPLKALSIKEALFSPSIENDIENCIGKTLASANISCPPAVPIIVAGEIIDENTIKCFKYYKINKCRIVKN